MAAVHPDLVDRLVAVVPCASVDAYTLARTATFAPSSCSIPNGPCDYARTARPLKGWPWPCASSPCFPWRRRGAISTGASGRTGEGPCLAHGPHLRHQYLYRLPRRASAQTIDANSLIYTARANELFTVGGAPTLEEGLKAIKAKVLLIPAKNDRLFPPEQTRKVRTSCAPRQ